MKKLAKRVISSLLIIMILCTCVPIGINANAKSATYVDRQSIVEYAKKFEGYPYRSSYGPNAFDCCGLVKYVYGHFGIKLPWTCWDYKKYGEVISESEAKPGDLVVWHGKHVGIFIEKNKIINALNPTKGVVYSDYHKLTNGEPSYYIHINGVVDYALYNIETACDKTLQTVEDTVYVRKGPYYEKDVARKIYGKGTLVHVKAYYLNKYNHIWYKTDDNNWIYSPRLGNLSTYSISYNANGGKNAPSKQTKTQGTSITLSKNQPTRSFHKFLGWSTSKKAKSATYHPGDTYKKDAGLTLYAVWERNTTKIKLSSYSTSLCINDGNSKDITVTLTGYLPKNSKIVAASTNGNTETKVEKISDFTLLGIGSIKKKVTITGKNPGWDTVKIRIVGPDGYELTSATVSVNVTKKYFVTYNANGGTGAPAQQVKMHGKTAAISDKIPTRTNYKFVGWATSATSSTPVYGPGDIYKADKDITLYAVWNEKYNITSSYDASTKTLTISGKGDMECYSEKTKAPWQSYAATAEKVVIKSGVTSIGSYAFYNFTNLKQVEANYTVKKIYSYAFAGCRSLNSIKAGKSISIGSHAFSNCTSLQFAKFDQTAAKLYSAMAVNAEDAAEIGAFAFENCTSLQSIELNDNVTEIGESAFSGCSSLDNVVIPESVERLNDTVFFNCTSLESVEIPDSVTEIMNGTFNGCSSIESINIPESVETLGDQVFSGCSDLNDVVIPDSVTNFGDSIFSNCTSLSNVSLPEDAEYLGNAMFSGCTSLSSVELPANISDIGEGTFMGCTSLSGIEIPEHVSVIGNSAFLGCTSIKEFNISDGISSIEDFAFYGCTGLTNMEFTDNVMHIGSCAFADCTSLSSVTFASGVEEISDGAFMYCESLKSVSFADDEPVSIGEEAFAECTSLKNVEIPESAVYVSISAFSACSSSLKVSCYSTSAVLDDVTSSGVTYNVIYPVEGISITADKTNLIKNQTANLSVKFTPTNATNKNVTWISENEDIATVDNNGKVTAISSGVAIIKAISNDGNYTQSIEIDCDIPVNSFYIVEKYDEIITDMCIPLDYSFNSESPTNIGVNWSSSNPDVISINSEGEMFANKVGTVTITASTEDGTFSDSFVISARDFIPVESIKLSSSNLNLNVGEKKKLTYDIYPMNADISYYECYSEDESIATIDDDGFVNAVSEGTTRIVFFCGGLTETCTVVVGKKQKAVNSVTIGNDFELNYKSTSKLNPSIDADSGVKYKVEYKSSDNNVATVDSNGNVYGAKDWIKKAATITCTVTDEYGNSVSDTCNVTCGFAWWQWIIGILLFGWIWY